MMLAPYHAVPGSGNHGNFRNRFPTPGNPSRPEPRNPLNQQLVFDGSQVPTYIYRELRNRFASNPAQPLDGGDIFEGDARVSATATTAVSFSRPTTDDTDQGITDRPGGGNFYNHGDGTANAELAGRAQLMASTAQLATALGTHRHEPGRERALLGGHHRGRAHSGSVCPLVGFPHTVRDMQFGAIEPRRRRFTHFRTCYALRPSGMLVMRHNHSERKRGHHRETPQTQLALPSATAPSLARGCVATSPYDLELPRVGEHCPEVDHEPWSRIADGTIAVPRTRIGPTWAHNPERGDRARADRRAAMIATRPDAIFDDSPPRALYVALMFARQLAEWRPVGEYTQPMEAARACVRAFHKHWREIGKQARILRVLTEHRALEDFFDDGIDGRMLADAARSLSAAIAVQNENVARLLDAPTPEDAIRIHGTRYQVNPVTHVMEMAPDDISAGNTADRLFVQAIHAAMSSAQAQSGDAITRTGIDNALLYLLMAHPADEQPDASDTSQRADRLFGRIMASALYRVHQRTGQVVSQRGIDMAARFVSGVREAISGQDGVVVDAIEDASTPLHGSVIPFPGSERGNATEGDEGDDGGDDDPGQEGDS